MTTKWNIYRAKYKANLVENKFYRWY